MDIKQVLLDLADHLIELSESNIEDLRVIRQERLDNTHEITTSKLNDLNIREAKCEGEAETLTSISNFLTQREEV